MARTPGSLGDQGRVTRFWMLLAYQFKRDLQEKNGGRSYLGINKGAAGMTVRHLEEREPGYFGSRDVMSEAETQIRTYLELGRYSRELNLLIVALEKLVDEGRRVLITDDGVTIDGVPVSELEKQGTLPPGWEDSIEITHR